MKNLLVFALLFLATGLAAAADRPKVLFLTGDHEYRSEESMPMIARLLEKTIDCDVEIGFSVDKNGFVNPMQDDSVTGIEKLDDADLLVLFYRYRRPSPEQFQHFLDYLKAGKPIVAFRTSTHAFRFAEGAGMDEWGFQNDPKAIHSLAGGEKVRELLGQTWITHHGHFDDGQNPLTAVTINADQTSHPILRGVGAFDAYSWLYHVEGGGDSVAGEPIFLLTGRSLKSAKAQKDQTDRYPLENPVAWTKKYQVEGGERGKVFTTTLGHPYDFRLEPMRRIAVQGILWALDRETDIPAEGVNVDLDPDHPYEPNNSGFGDDTFKQGLKPEDLFESE